MLSQPLKPTDTSWREDATALTSLALALGFAQLNVSLTYFISTALAGRADALTLAGCGLGGSINASLTVLVQGLAFGVEPFVAQALGGGRVRDAKGWVKSAIVTALVLSVPLCACAWWGAGVLELAGIAPPLAQAVREFLLGRLPSLPLFAVICVLRIYLQASHQHRVIVLASVFMNGLNLALSFALLFGAAGLQRLGLPGFNLPALGIFGLGLGGSIALVLQMAILAYAVYADTPGESVPAEDRKPRVGRIVTMGVPIGLQMFAEVGLFSFVGLFMGAMGTEAMAAHQTVLVIATLSFGLCVGIGDATAVQTGRAVGAGNLVGARRAGFIGLGLAAGVMLVSSGLMWGAPAMLVGLVTHDKTFLPLASRLLGVAAVFQLVDGTQAVCAGALRGIGRTKTSFYANVLAHWCVGMPTAYLLGITFGLGPVGLWWGLVAGLATAACALSVAFLRVRHQDLVALDPVPDA